MAVQIFGDRQSCVPSIPEQNHVIQPRCFNPNQAAQSNLSVQAVERHSKQRRTVNVARASPPNPELDYDTVPVANRVPIINVEVSCHAADKLPVDQNIDRCLLTEGSARDELDHKWTEFPMADRSHCVRYSSTDGGYTDLLTCLEMKLYVRNLQNKNRSVARQ
jgi:hypothetical protein